MQLSGDFADFRVKLIRKVASDKTSQRKRAAAEPMGSIGIWIGQIGVADEASSKRAGKIRQRQPRMTVITAVDNHITHCIQAARKKILAARRVGSEGLRGRWMQQ